MAQPSATVFLMYHELELPGRQLCQNDPGYVHYIISADEFASEMKQIHELGLRGLSVGNALTFAEPAVCITFDDGCETDLITAAPILKELGFGATFYVVAGFIGKPGFLSIAQLRELHGLGFEIGCHSMSHPYLPDLNDFQLQHEIADAKVMIEQMIGAPIEHFSCPGGRYDGRVAAVARRAGFRTVATSIPRVNRPSTDPFALARVAIVRGMKPSDFTQISLGKSLWKAELGMGARDRVKRLLGNKLYDRIRGLLLRS